MQQVRGTWTKEDSSCLRGQLRDIRVLMTFELGIEEPEGDQGRVGEGLSRREESLCQSLGAGNREEDGYSGVTGI